MLAGDADPVRTKYPNLPEFGKLRGKKVRLADAVDRLTQADLDAIEVDVPGVGVVRPWHFAGDVEVRGGVLTIC